MSDGQSRLAALGRAASDALENDLLPFWHRMEDRAHGGHFAAMSHAGVLDRRAPKSTVFVARILWTMSEAGRSLGSASSIEQARHANDDDSATADMVGKPHCERDAEQEVGSGPFHIGVADMRPQADRRQCRERDDEEQDDGGKAGQADHAPLLLRTGLRVNVAAAPAAPKQARLCPQTFIRLAARPTVST